MPNEITIAICAYNSGKYIAGTLRRIAGQTFQAFDLLIVNDCSTDNTAQVVVDFFEETPRDYSLINLEVNGGIANARQVALERSGSKYILFVDSDDLPHRTLVEREYSLISSDRDIMAVSCWSEYMDMSGKKLRGGLCIGPETKEEFMSVAARNKLVFLPIQTMFDRVAALRAGGFRLEGFRDGKPRYRDFCEDLDLWTRMSDLYAEGRYMVTIPEALYSYRKGNSGLSANTAGMSLKIRYVKANLLRRRSGRREMAFTEFMDGVTEKEMRGIVREAKGVDCLRNGVFLLFRWRVFAGTYYVLKAMLLNPKYLMQKLKVSSGIFK